MIVHLDEKEARKGICESCINKNALTEEYETEVREKIFVCKFCGHRETFLSNGKRKENPNYTKYC